MGYINIQLDIYPVVVDTLVNQGDVMNTITKNIKAPAEYRISHCESNGVTTFSCEIFVFGQRVGRSPYIGEYKSIDAAMKAAYEDYKTDYLV